MILPKSGRVIILDDKINQALPLINALSKNNTATAYFSGDVSTAPDNTFKDVRVLFLDINLTQGQSIWENEKTTIIANIKRIVEPMTPYILFIWSVNEQSQYDDVVTLFGEELIDYKPVSDPIKMDKNAFFNLVDVETDKWELANTIDETLELLNQKINEGIKTIESLEGLLKWDNIVIESSSNVVNDIVRLASEKNDMNSDLKQIYRNLATAYWGKTLNGKTSDVIITKSLVTLNAILSDKIEFKIMNELKIDAIADFPTKPELDPFIKSQLNTKLLFSEDLINEALPGNMYVFTNDPYKNDIVNNIIDRGLFADEYCSEKQIDVKDIYDEKLRVKEEHNTPFKKFGYRKINEIIADTIYVEFEVTPICEFSQNNRLFCRMVSGIIMDEKYRKKIKRAAQFFYVSPVFTLDGKSVNFYCDFRYIISKEGVTLEGVSPKLRLRHLVQADIQSHMARQVSRPGIVSL